MIKAIGNILIEFWAVLSEMAPYLLLGFAVAGVLAVVLPTRWVLKHLGGSGFGPIFKASALGVPLPLCSCGVIPVAAGLRRSGATRASVVSFLLSTPQTGVDSILVTYSLMGPLFAIYRPIAALLTGVIGGAGTLLIGGKTVQQATEQTSVESPTAETTHGLVAKVIAAAKYGFVTLPADIGKSLLIGLILAGAITVALPPHFIADHVGTGLLSMLLLMLLGIPVYVCATASVPIAAALILHQGVSPGAALAFLMTGPATNAATIVTIAKTMGWKTAGVYLLTTAVMALGLGLLLDLLFAQAGAQVHPGGLHEMVPGASAVQTASAVVLIVVIAYGLARPWVRKMVAKGVAVDADLILNIEGMTCSHCVGRVEKALAGAPGVEDVTVDLETGRAVIQGAGADPAALVAAVDQAGYKAAVAAGEE